MSDAARRRLERIALLSRALAVLLALVVGGQVYARSGGAAVASLAGLGAFALIYALLLALLRRQRRLLRELDPAPREVPPPTRKPRRRVLTDSDGD